MLLRFTKMHGLGNDFMVLDLVSQHAHILPKHAKQWGDRHTGVGFDQLLLVETPTNPDVDFRYRIFNSDGSEVEQYGNGARCFARFVLDKRPPGRSISSGESIQPWLIAATAAAHAPVPQAWVSPAPRSQTRNCAR